MLFNEGNVFDIIMGKFIVLIDGVYLFSWGVMLDRGKLFVIEIVLNSNLVIGNYVDGWGYNSLYVMLFL